jgi:hypothetical protein
MSSQARSLLITFMLVLLMAVAIATVPFIVGFDVIQLENKLSESSVTELTQELLLAISVLLFLITAVRRPESRGFLVLVTGFLACMLIREGDMWFDLITKGFWVYPATLCAAVSIYLAIRNRGTVLLPMNVYTRSQSFAIMAVGLLIVIVFSRLFGTHSLWLEIMQHDYEAFYKTVIQEGIELLGYWLVFAGSVLHYRKNWASTQER